MASGLISEAPDSLFKAPRLHLGRFWNDFLQIFGQMPRKPRTPRTPAKTRPRSRVRQEWMGSGAASLGGFNGIGAKFVVFASSVCWVLGNLPRLYRVTGHLSLEGLSLASLASVPTSQVINFRSTATIHYTDVQK